MSIELLQKLAKEHRLTLPEWRNLLADTSKTTFEKAQKLAQNIAQEHFGTGIYFRGIIECTNYCKNECHYCGLQSSNRTLTRYRLPKEAILAACAEGYEAKIRTFVLQGGEDPALTDAVLIDLVESIAQRYPDCAITLSFGERSKESYQKLICSGAKRYLLRHEAASPALYETLHSQKQSFWHRINCLYELKALGYQTGCGMMIGAPSQSTDDLAQDFAFIQDFHPHMLGIGPFIPNSQTIYRNETQGSCEQTLYCLSLARILFPTLLLPATTALRVLDPKGLSLGVNHGCNVVMPSITPRTQKTHYRLYDTYSSKEREKQIFQASVQENIASFSAELESIGYHLHAGIGDAPQ